MEAVRHVDTNINKSSVPGGNQCSLQSTLLPPQKAQLTLQSALHLAILQIDLCVTVGSTSENRPLQMTSCVQKKSASPLAALLFSALATPVFSCWFGPPSTATTTPSTSISLFCTFIGPENDHCHLYQPLSLIL